ncbi:hypothetical protein RFI_20379 [Reticulomyxa filosa]|uniref:Uncharacterized protein n=1 Tax=Reticulomyxa filosa TaxID=46433 RepID=X6MSM1_RETFI|nr:hypothetical protein RFI_20379 [Reticulomyxa filosa]|eukprot:ETO16958.1 hypothetical protein RFI_20379 [Reticulomyxa filosa]
MEGLRKLQEQKLQGIAGIGSNGEIVLSDAHLTMRDIEPGDNGYVDKKTGKSVIVDESKQLHRKVLPPDLKKHVKSSYTVVLMPDGKASIGPRPAHERAASANSHTFFCACFCFILFCFCCCCCDIFFYFVVATVCVFFVARLHLSLCVAKLYIFWDQCHTHKTITLKLVRVLFFVFFLWIFLFKEEKLTSQANNILIQITQNLFVKENDRFKIQVLIFGNGICYPFDCCAFRERLRFKRQNKKKLIRSKFSKIEILFMFERKV